jgi:hypothetical protein
MIEELQRLQHRDRRYATLVEQLRALLASFEQDLNWLTLMCGRYTSTSGQAKLVEFFAVDEVRSEELPVRYNVAPTQVVYAVVERRPRESDEVLTRQLRGFRWGLVPSWARDRKIGNRMINLTPGPRPWPPRTPTRRR